MASRFSEDAFRRYELIITSAMCVLPSEFKFNSRQPPLKLAGETVRSRIRDAMFAYHQHPEWRSSVNRLAFDRYYPELEVGGDDDEVAIRLRSTRGGASRSADAVRPRNYIDVEGKVDLTTSIIALVINKQLNGVELANCPLDDAALKQFIGGDDVAFVREGNTIIVI